MTVCIVWKKHFALNGDRCYHCFAVWSEILLIFWEADSLFIEHWGTQLTGQQGMKFGLCLNSRETRYIFLVLTDVAKVGSLKNASNKHQGFLYFWKLLLMLINNSSILNTGIISKVLLPTLQTVFGQFFQMPKCSSKILHYGSYFQPFFFRCLEMWSITVFHVSYYIVFQRRHVDNVGTLASAEVGVTSLMRPILISLYTVFHGRPLIIWSWTS